MAAVDDFYFSESDGDMSAPIGPLRLSPRPRRGSARRRRGHSPPAGVAKDSDEEELERLVLGGGDRLRQRLFADDLLNLGDADPARGGVARTLQLVVDTDAGLDLTSVADADLFVLDTVGDPAALQPSSGSLEVADVPALRSGDGVAPVWHDSDDDRLMVSLASAPSLRKLRIAEAEDVISGAEYCLRLRQQFLRLNPEPAWARLRSRRLSQDRSNASEDEDERQNNAGDNGDSDADLSTLPLSRYLRNAVALMTVSGPAKRRRLQPETIDIQRSRDISTVLSGPVTSLSFHPLEPILLSSGPQSAMYVHRIDPAAHPTPNPELLSVRTQRAHLRRALFIGPRGDRVLFAGRHHFIHDWDLHTGAVRRISNLLGHHSREHRAMDHFRASPCGRWLAILASTRKGGGSLSVLDADTMQWVASARLDSRHGVADFAWWRSSAGLTILGKDGRLGEWSLTDRAFAAIWHDHGCLNATVLALGGVDGPPHMGGDRWVAVGSGAGIANLYDRNQLFPAIATSPLDLRPTPARILEQLVTSITALAFSPDGQLLALASELKPNALRLVHLPTCTVYRNWPRQNTPLGNVSAVAFAAHDPILAVGNRDGKIRLWDIRA